MKNRLVAGFIGAVLSAVVLAVPAAAACRDSGTCGYSRSLANKTLQKKPAAVHKTKRAHVVHQRNQTRHARKSGRSRIVTVPAKNGGAVPAMITSMAPSYGVPAWFALRIAKVESNYNPNARGSAGEYGVFQLKCATARGIGFRGSCSGLLNARTNVQYGLKHLSLAIRGSGGNLHLAASKHNGGLGRKKLVRGYVAMVF